MKIVIKLFIVPFLVIMLIPFFSTSSSTGTTTDVSFDNFNYSMNIDTSKSSSNNLNNRVPAMVYGTNSHKINSAFGYRYDPKTGEKAFHTATDYACRYGDPVYAVADGEVTVNTIDSYGGLSVQIKHSKGIYTKYVHMQKVYISVGDFVSQGQVIAECGSTGYSTGPHLHLALIIDGQYVDIAPYLE